MTHLDDAFTWETGQHALRAAEKYDAAAQKAGDPHAPPRSAYLELNSAQKAHVDRLMTELFRHNTDSNHPFLETLRSVKREEFSLDQLKGTKSKG